ncbi:MAG: Nif11-like leader peptide family natural product precursor [Chlorobium sp.]
MSLEQAKLFVDKLKSDTAFRERVTAIEHGPARLAFIRSEGFQCTETEIKEVLGELSDNDLDQACGGIYKNYSYTIQ